MPDVRAAIIPVTPFQQNCTLLWCEKTKKAAVIDPGGDLDRIREAIAQSGVSVEKIILTHGHIDHAGGAAELREELGVPVEGPHEADRFLLERLAEQGQAYGFAGPRRDAGPLAERGRHGERRRPHPRRAALPRPFAGQRRPRLAGRNASPSSATCCSRARSGAPTFPAATARH